MQGESICHCNWMIQQASQVLGTMESMASISVLIQLLTDSIIYPANETIDRSMSEVWTGYLQNRIIPDSSCPMTAAL